MRLFRDPAFSVMKETVFVCSLASMHVGFRVGIGKQETTFISLIRPMSGILRLVFVFD